MSGANASAIARSDQEKAGANASAIARSNQEKAGANASAIARSHQEKAGANASAIARSDKVTAPEARVRASRFVVTSTLTRRALRAGLSQRERRNGGKRCHWLK